MPLASLPWRFARATSSPAAFCSRFSPSSSGISRRRRFSSVASFSNSPSTCIPRFSNPRFTASWLSRTKAGSSIVKLYADWLSARSLSLVARSLTVIGFTGFLSYQLPATSYQQVEYFREIIRSQSRVPRSRPWHPVSSRDQGSTQRNAPARRQADYSVRRRGSRRIGRREHHYRYRPRQERHRGSF